MRFFMEDKKSYTPQEVVEIITAYKEHQKLVDKTNDINYAGNGVNAKRLIEALEESRSRFPKNIQDLLF